MIQFGRLSWYGIAEGKAFREIDFNSPTVVAALTDLRKKAFVNKYSIPLSEGGRPDRTSLSLYKNTNYFWVLMQINDIQDPFQEWAPLKLIRYPNLGDIASALNKISVDLKLEDTIRVYLDSVEDNIGTTKPISG